MRKLKNKNSKIANKEVKINGAVYINLSVYLSWTLVNAKMLYNDTVILNFGELTIFYE